MLNLLSKYFRMLPGTFRELTGNFYLRNARTYLLRNKILLIAIMLIYTASSIFCSTRFVMKIYDLIYLGSDILFLFFYMLINGLLHPSHWIELIFIAILFRRILSFYKETYLSSLPRHDFSVGIFFSFIIPLFIFDIVHLACYNSVSIIENTTKSKYIYALAVNPFFYMSSFSMSVILLLFFLFFSMYFRSMILNLFLTALVGHFIIPFIIHLVFTSFINNMIERIYFSGTDNLHVSISLDNIPYFLVAVIMFCILGNYIERNIYDRYSKLYIENV